jgi:hypothetical protein
VKTKTKLTTALATAAVAALVLTGCGPSDAQQAYKDRQAKQQQTTVSDSLALDNLGEKRDRENDPNTVRYLYLMNFGQIVGYYVTKGNITSNAAQIAPEQEVVKAYSDGYVVDSAQDDGTYGDGDPGVFFFTADGTMVVTSLDYIQSDQPLAIDVPRLGGSE